MFQIAAALVLFAGFVAVQLIDRHRKRRARRR